MYKHNKHIKLAFHSVWSRQQFTILNQRKTPCM